MFVCVCVQCAWCTSAYLCILDVFGPVAQQIHRLYRRVFRGAGGRGVRQIGSIGMQNECERGARKKIKIGKINIAIIKSIVRTV